MFANPKKNDDRKNPVRLLLLSNLFPYFLNIKPVFAAGETSDVESNMHLVLVIILLLVVVCMITGYVFYAKQKEKKLKALLFENMQLGKMVSCVFYMIAKIDLTHIQWFRFDPNTGQFVLQTGTESDPFDVFLRAIEEGRIAEEQKDLYQQIISYSYISRLVLAQRTKSFDFRKRDRETGEYHWHSVTIQPLETGTDGTQSVFVYAKLIDDEKLVEFLQRQGSVPQDDTHN